MQNYIRTEENYIHKTEKYIPDISSKISMFLPSEWNIIKNIEMNENTHHNGAHTMTFI